jgi:hypothetical protein
LLSVALGLDAWVPTAAAVGSSLAVAAGVAACGHTAAADIVLVSLIPLIVNP